MTNSQPPRRPPGPPPLPPRLDQVRPIEERFAPPPGQRTGGRPAAGPPHAPRAAPPGGRHRPQPARRRGFGFGTVLVALISVLGIVIAAGAAFVLLAPPTDLIREQAIAAVKQRTGRDLTIAGPARLTFYPSLGVSLTDVSLSPPPGMAGGPTLAMDSLDVDVKLMPLLSRRVEVARLVLTRPNFDLRVDKTGRKSWQMAMQPAPLRYAEAAADARASDALPATPIQLAQRGGTGAPAGGQRLAQLEDLVLEDVRIVDGTIDYADERTGARQRATSVDLKLGARTLASPLSAEGDLYWQGQTIRFDGSVTTLAEVLENKPFKLAANVAAKPLQARYAGSVTLDRGASLEGTVSAKSASLRALALWLGSELPPGDGFGALELAGRLKTEANTFRLDNADITLDAMKVTGSLAGVTGGVRPLVKADLKVSELNLNTYLLPGGSGGGATPAPVPSKPAPATEPPAAGTPKPAAPPQSIEDLLQRQGGPRVKGYTARAGWSDEPINVAMLALVDADARLSVGRLIYRNVKVGPADVVLALKDKVARATFERVSLYEGSGRGMLTVDAGKAAPEIAASFVIDNVSAAPLLADAGGIDWLSGRGKLTLATTSRGATQRQIVSALNGKASFSFADGAVSGFNVAKILRGLSQGQLANLSATPSEKTDFSDLSASFDIVDGIATNKDLTLMSPLLRVTGDGRIMLPDRQVDYTARPKLVADATGQGGATGLTGLEVPLRITGSWERPKIAPDLSKIDAKQAVQAVEEIGRKLKGKDAGEIVDEVFGKDTKEGQKAKQFLDKLFR